MNTQEDHLVWTDGAKLRALRDESPRVTQATLAQALSVDPKQLRALERVKGPTPYETVRRFVEALAKCKSYEIGGREPFQFNVLDYIRFETLRIPTSDWVDVGQAPSTILKPEHQVVPFDKAREKEKDELVGWCRTDPKPPPNCTTKILHGKGGMGKTRLAIELCGALDREKWLAGFLKPESASVPELWDALAHDQRHLLLVVDYAEHSENRDSILAAFHCVENILKKRTCRIRILLVTREHNYWRQMLAKERSVTEFLVSKITTTLDLPPLAPSKTRRKACYETALEVFSEKLNKKPRKGIKPNLKDPLYNQILLLHMTALAAVEGHKLENASEILEYYLARERRFWSKLIENETLLPIIERSVAYIRLDRGAKTLKQALQLITPVVSSYGHNNPDLPLKIAQILHQAYPGDQYIEPLQPDLLGELLGDQHTDDPIALDQLSNLHE